MNHSGFRSTGTMAQFLLIALGLLAFQAFTGSAIEFTYDGFGKFTDRDFYDPIVRPMVLLPKSPDLIAPKFYLFTSKDQNESEWLFYDAPANFTSSKFDRKAKTKILVHGFNDLLGTYLTKMKNAWLESGTYNVILVDWQNGAELPYARSVSNARIVGQMIGKFIEHLYSHFDVSQDSIHILGHSLGAHVAAYAGKYLNGRVGRITGLDPAGPYFEGHPDHRARLWLTDAKFVDVIHTSDIWGMNETCGHVDIYPNGGHRQPGCLSERFMDIAIEGPNGETVRRLLFCDHLRSTDYFVESIMKPMAVPVAYHCDNYEAFEKGNCTECGPNGAHCVVLGPGAENYRKFLNYPSLTVGGRFFMKTKPHSKFFGYQSVITMAMAPSHPDGKPATSHGRVTLEFIYANGTKTEAVPFNEEKESFEYNTTVSRVVVLDIDPEQIDQIEFHWTKRDHSIIPFEIISSKVYVESLEIFPLTYQRETWQERLYFLPEKQRISSRRGTLFKKASSL